MSANRPYIESHSALRGIAAVVVVLHHLRAFDLIPNHGMVGRGLRVIGWGDVAVYLFFVLSGFVMSYVYPSPVRWREFFVARLARLVPVYEVTLLAMVATILWKQLHEHVSSLYHPPLSAGNVVANLLMIQKWLPVRDWYAINLPSWSLSVEAFLYVALFPLLVGSRRWISRPRFYAALFGLAAVAAAVLFGMDFPGVWTLWWRPLGEGCLGFGLGFCLHQLMTKPLRFPGVVAAAALLLIAGCLGCRILVPAVQSDGFLALGLAALVVASVERATWLYRMLARPVFLYLGDVSYSLYLSHYPVVLFFVVSRARLESHIHSRAEEILFRVLYVGVLTGLCFLIAHLSYRFLEVPFRRLIRDRFVRAEPGARA